MNSKLPRIVLVDPYSSGNMLAETLARQGAVLMAVSSWPPPDESLRKTMQFDQFDCTLQDTGNWEELLEAVSQFNPTRVLAGFAPGMMLADRINHELQLPGNRLELSESRNDKFAMQMALNQAGLRAAKQCKSNFAGALRDQALCDLSWPCVVKPARSIGSDQVGLCETPDELEREAAKILTSTNRLGRRNETVVAQEYLDGIEYVVDTVSHAGRHKVTAYWEYHRPEPLDQSRQPAWYDQMTLIDYVGDRQAGLRDYTFSLLDALGVIHGPVHCEIMWFRDEPVLVEINCRMSASVNAILSRECGGICQLDETVSELLNPSKFLSTVDRVPRLSSCAANVFIFPPRTGRLKSLRGLEHIESLPSLYRLSISAKTGQLMTGGCVGSIVLKADSADQLQRDLALIRELEATELFELQESPEVVNG